MPKKVSEFLIGLAKKSGVELTPEQQEHISKIDVELDDNFVNPIDNSLISLRDAKNNHPDIKNHYVKGAYDGIDSLLLSQMEEYEFGENEKNAILAERNTNKRVALMNKMVKDLEHRKANADKPDKAAINKQIEDLNAEIRAHKAQVEAIRQESENKFKQFKIDSKKQTLLSNYKTIYDDLSPEVKYMTLFNLLNKDLQDNNAEFVLGEGDSINLLKKDGTNYYGDNNQQMNTQQFIESSLSRNKILKTTSTAAQQSAGDTQQNNANPNGGTSNGNGKAQNHLLKSLNSAALESIKQNAANPVFGGAMGV